MVFGLKDPTWTLTVPCKIADGFTATVEDESLIHRVIEPVPEVLARSYQGTFVTDKLSCLKVGGSGCEFTHHVNSISHGPAVGKCWLEKAA